MKWRVVLLIGVIVILSSFVSAKTIKNGHTDCEGSTCTWSSNVRFGYEESQWKPIKEMKSIKGIYTVNYLEVDPAFSFIVNDYNYSWIDYCIETTYDRVNIPFTFYDVNNNTYSVTYKLRKNSQHCDTFSIPLQYQDQFNVPSNLIHWGYNSTTIRLVTSDGLLEDSFLDTALPDNSNDGVGLYAHALSASNPDNVPILKFNISSIPASQTIVSSMLYVTIVSNRLDAASEGFNLSATRATEDGWKETTVTWNNRPANASERYDSLKLFGGAGEPTGRQSWNVTSIVSTDYGAGKSNSSIYLMPHNPFGAASASDYVQFGDREDFTESNRPFLNITYEAGGCTPSIVNTSWTPWINVSCLTNDTMNQSSNLTQYDENACGGSNTTFWQYAYNLSCGYAPVIKNFKFYAINSTGDVLGGSDVFNTTDLEEIEFTNITFEVQDFTGISGDIRLYYTSGGSGSCAPGNKQIGTCYNKTNDNWIWFQNGTETSTFKDEGNQGDFIECDYTGNASYRNYSCRIDEHYNPNVMKWYNASYNFSDVKWQTGTSQRITRNNMLRIQLQSVVPLDADQYKLDFRVLNTSGVLTPVEPLEAYGCNSSYTTGDPQLLPECILIASKFPTELQDDGTKFRGIFTKELVDQLGDGKYIILKTAEQNPSRYYAIKTYANLTANWENRFEYSTDTGSNWVNNTDGYETEMNINWFYSGASPTSWHVKVWANETYGTQTNSSEYVLNWTIDAAQDYPPLVSIIVPLNNATVNGTVAINWTDIDPNNDTVTKTVNISNATYDVNIAEGLGYYDYNTTWNTSIVPDGVWNITVRVCEVGTVDLFCTQDVHEVNLVGSNYTAPTVPPPEYNITGWLNISTNQRKPHMVLNYTNIFMPCVILNQTRYFT